MSQPFALAHSRTALLCSRSAPAEEEGEGEVAERPAACWRFDERRPPPSRRAASTNGSRASRSWDAFLSDRSIWYVLPSSPNSTVADASEPSRSSTSWTRVRCATRNTQFLSVAVEGACGRFSAARPSCQVLPPDGPKK